MPSKNYENANKTSNIVSSEDLTCLKALEKKILWLSAWMIHNANNIRESRDGLKVGGHQASCASVTTLMTALYFNVLTDNDRVAVKPHASPVYHAIQYLYGRQEKSKLEGFRSLGGAQSYPSRTKDSDGVDFSTGSVGLGVGTTLFASLVQDYLHLRRLAPKNKKLGRMVAIMGDAELDEGNVFEALLEGWKHESRNLWWIIDYNRQSLDRVVSDRLFQKIKDFFDAVGWKVIILKYGKLLKKAFKEKGGKDLQKWIDECPNELYSALTFIGGAAFRKKIESELGHIPGVMQLIGSRTDEQLHKLMTNLAGHDMEAVIEGFQNVDDSVPHCFIIYTIKGFGLPFAGHKDNHAGLMNNQQMASFRDSMKITDGEEWDYFSGLNVSKKSLENFLARTPLYQPKNKVKDNKIIEVPETLPLKISAQMSTQEAFGKILNELGKGDTQLADRIVTTSPDVTVSTNLGGWVNRRGIFNRAEREDIYDSEKVVSMQKWALSKAGQHIELGIAENNLFLLLSALGLSEQVFGTKLLPIGTVYDPFIARGLDALNYACYQDSRFMLAGTPSGITLAPEGGAHQSIYTPLIGLGQPGLTTFEPAYADELAEIMRWGFEYMQESDGGSIYIRLTTRAITQPSRQISNKFRDNLLKGAYWMETPLKGSKLAIIVSGAVTPEAKSAYDTLHDEIPGLGLLIVSSLDRLFHDWLLSRTHDTNQIPNYKSHIEKLLELLADDACLITVSDSHPASLSWLGSVMGHQPYCLGITDFGESGDIIDLYAKHKIDKDSIVEAAATACLKMLK